MIRSRGIDYQLTAMGTLIETDTVSDALAVVQQAADLLHKAGCRRIYSSIKMDIREEKEKRLQGKLSAIQARIGEINT